MIAFDLTLLILFSRNFRSNNMVESEDVGLELWVVVVDLPIFNLKYFIIIKSVIENV